MFIRHPSREIEVFMVTLNWWIVLGLGTGIFMGFCFRWTWRIHGFLRNRICTCWIYHTFRWLGMPEWILTTDLLW
jgi:hypothetical protein